jgi:hypothetical protein
MFETIYDYKFKGAFPKKTKEGATIISYSFTFCGLDGTKYVFLADRHTEHLFAVKFYAKKYNNNPNKYAVRTKAHDVKGVLGTCLTIMEVEILGIDPKASICFIGEPDVGETHKQPNKRFRVWLPAVTRYFNMGGEENRLFEEPAILEEKHIAVFINSNLTEEEKQRIYDYVDGINI